jgi:hypothetical protein
MSAKNWLVKPSAIRNAVRGVMSIGLPVREVRVSAEGDIRILTGEPEAPPEDGRPNTFDQVLGSH